MISDIKTDTAPYLVAALYKFVRVSDVAALIGQLQRLCDDHGIKGTLLVAPEGINGTIAGGENALRAVLAALGDMPLLSGLEWKESWASEPPFHRMKVKNKREIVTMGVGDLDPARHAGTYVKPEDWNALIAEEGVVVVDTRNDYEVSIGTFDGAIDPKTKSFREFPQWVEDNKDALDGASKIAMFCTGGIRCEKSTAYLKAQGYSDVYHLEGGILKYLEDINEDDSRWQGSCFVFDERVAVDHGLRETDYSMCRACRRPLDDAARRHPAFEDGVSCQYCIEEASDVQRARYRERQRQVERAESRGEQHIGQAMASSGSRNRTH